MVTVLDTGSKIQVIPGAAGRICEQEKVTSALLVLTNDTVVLAPVGPGSYIYGAYGIGNQHCKAHIMGQTGQLVSSGDSDCVITNWS